LHEAALVGESSIEGRGLFTDAPLDAGVVVIRLGGRLLSTSELDRLLRASTRFVDTLTVFDDAHLVLPPGTPVHYGNHSCDPTLWHVGPYEIATRRRVDAGEELTIDYATHTARADFSMPCRCGADGCRGVVTGQDWQRAELQDRYAGHWVPALAARIGRRGEEGR
jgi:hypothetical protein